jgi:hypothetical protein
MVTRHTYEFPTLFSILRDELPGRKAQLLVLRYYFSLMLWASAVALRRAANPWKAKFAGSHINFPTLESNALCFEEKALLQGVFSGGYDSAAGA